MIKTLTKYTQSLFTVSLSVFAHVQQSFNFHMYACAHYSTQPTERSRSQKREKEKHQMTKEIQKKKKKSDSDKTAIKEGK